MQVVVEQLTQLRRDALCTAIVLVNHCRLAVRVGIQFRARMDDLLPVFDEIEVGADAVQHSRLGEQLFVLRQPLFMGVLLQDD